MTLLIIILIWLLWSTLNGLIGRGRFIGFSLAFWMSVFLSPLVGFFISLGSSIKK